MKTRRLDHVDRRPDPLTCLFCGHPGHLVELPGRSGGSLKLSLCDNCIDAHRRRVAEIDQGTSR